MTRVTGRELAAARISDIVLLENRISPQSIGSTTPSFDLWQHIGLPYAVGFGTPLAAADAQGSSLPLGNPEMQTSVVPTNVDDLVVVGEWRAAAQAAAKQRHRLVRH